MLYCLVAFILGWFVSRHMGNGFGVGGEVGGKVGSCRLVDDGTTIEELKLNDEEKIIYKDLCENVLEDPNISIGYPYCGGKMLWWCEPDDPD